jgi:N-acetylmuramoyl-L-alanine amidase
MTTPKPIVPYRASTQETDVLARTLWGEARGEGILGMAAVAAVVMNRVRKPCWWGDSIISVCQARYQFSCWNDDDPNRVKLRRVDHADPLFAQAHTIASLAAAGWLADPTGGATHYHAVGINPKWAAGHLPSITIGRHKFYAGIR